MPVRTKLFTDHIHMSRVQSVGMLAITTAVPASRHVTRQNIDFTFASSAAEQVQQSPTLVQLPNHSPGTYDEMIVVSHASTSTRCHGTWYQVTWQNLVDTPCQANTRCPHRRTCMRRTRELGSAHAASHLAEAAALAMPALGMIVPPQEGRSSVVAHACCLVPTGLPPAHVSTSQEQREHFMFPHMSAGAW
jgi:hypothetical protein